MAIVFSASPPDAEEGADLPSPRWQLHVHESEGQRSHIAIAGTVPSISSPTRPSSRAAQERPRQLRGSQ